MDRGAGVGEGKVKRAHLQLIIVDFWCRKKLHRLALEEDLESRGGDKSASLALT